LLRLFHIKTLACFDFLSTPDLNPYRETAILELEKTLKKRLESIERIVIEVDSPTEKLCERDVQIIDTLPSIPSDDQYFRELMATFRADRELDDDNPAYTVNW
jgi:hypothetical protein